MLHGTTLSMQATTPEVLAAIKRENIGIARYQDLQQRYAQADIHTYTEVIMGLPLETRDSFKRGLDVVFEMGKHDDLRIYELAILPNAPMADPDSIRRYELQTIEKQMFAVAPGTPEDEVEHIPTVIATSTLTKAEWVECAVYARLVQCLHNGCYTRYLAIHLRRQYELPYHQFYDRLQQHFQAQPHSVLGAVLSALHDYYVRYQQDASLPELDLSTTSPEALELLTARRGMVGPTDWAWLCIAARIDQFYAELAVFLETLGLTYGAELPAVQRFQQDLLLCLDYDPRVGKLCRYAYDFPAYFRDGAPLAPRPVLVHFRDIHMGAAGQFPLERGNVEKFVPAAIGSGWTSLTHIYQHQLAEADISYDEIGEHGYVAYLPPHAQPPGPRGRDDRLHRS